MRAKFSRFGVVLAFSASIAVGIAISVGADSPWPTFNHGLSPTDIQNQTTFGLEANACAKCHRDIYEQWKYSRHAQAWTNAIFQEGFRLESKDRCLYCHAPLQEQFETIRTAEPYAGTGTLVEEGINCAACHIRGEVIYSSARSGAPFHRFEPASRLKGAEFCAGCHQFNFSSELHGRVITGNLPSQNTYGEWLEYKKMGGDKSCQDCHMPQGAHHWPGAHDHDFLIHSISLRIEKKKRHVVFILEAWGVGHRFPTGDLFRHVTLEIKAPSEHEFRVLHTLGRKYRTDANQSGQSFMQHLVADTSLKPFDQRKIIADIATPLVYRLRYHYVSPWHEQRSHLPAERLIVTLASGNVD